jgi:hypothetical protein
LQPAAVKRDVAAAEIAAGAEIDQPTSDRRAAGIGISDRQCECASAGFADPAGAGDVACDRLITTTADAVGRRNTVEIKRATAAEPAMPFI